MNSKPNIFVIHFRRWVSSWWDIVDGTIGILTLGVIKTNFSFKWIVRRAKQALEAEKNKD